jgi:outer membrane protein TolC
MTKISLKIVLAVYLFCITNVFAFSDTFFLSITDYLDIALEKNIELKLAKLSYLRKQVMVALQQEVLSPQFSITSEPLYGYSNTRLVVETETKDFYNHNFNIGIALSTFIPTGGTLSLSFCDSVSYNGADEIFTNIPVFTLGFSQPLFVNGGVFNTRGYTAERLIVGLSREMNKLELLQSNNQQILEILRVYCNVLVYGRKLDIIKQKAAVYIRELQLLEIRKDQGRLSVTDFWEKELEAKDYEKQVFDAQFLLSVEKKKLGAIVGLDITSTDILLEDILPVIEIPESISLEEAVACKIMDLQAQLNRLEIKKVMSDYAPKLGFDFSIEPQYSVTQSGSDDFAKSVTDLWGPESWIEYSGSLTLSLPFGQLKQGRLKQDVLEKEAELSELELEQAKTAYSNEKTELLEKILYLKAWEQLLSEQVEYYIRRKFEKEKLLEIKRISLLEVEIADVDVNSAKAELYINRVEIFLSILELYRLKGSDIYNLFFL